MSFFKRRQLLFWSNFIFPCNTSHVTDLHIPLTLIPEMRACALSARNLPLYFGGKFLFLFLSVWQNLLCLVCRLRIIRKLTEFTSFCNSVVKKPPRVLDLFREWRTGLRTPTLGKFQEFLSVFVYLVRLSSVKCNIRVLAEELNTLFIVFFSWTQLWIQGTRIQVEHLHLWMTCFWLAQSQERAPTRSPWQVPGWTLNLTLM